MGVPHIRSVITMAIATIAGKVTAPKQGLSAEAAMQQQSGGGKPA